VRLPLRSVLVCALSVAVLGLAACQDEEDPPSTGGTPSASASTGSASPATPSSGATSSPPSSTAFPGVTPASGPELKVTMTSLHAPDGWKLSETQFTSYDISAFGKGGQVQLIEMADSADVGLETTAEIFLKGQPDDATTKRLPNVFLGQDGTEALRFSWTVKGDDKRYESVQAYRSGTSVALNFTAEPGLLERDPDWVQSVLASLTWLR